MSRLGQSAIPIVVLGLVLLGSTYLMSNATQDSASFGELYSVLLAVNAVALIGLGVLIAWNPHGDRVGPEQRPGSACRGKARAGNGHRDGDHVPLQCHEAVCSGRSEMTGTGSGHRGRPTCPRLVDTDRQGVPSNQLAECSVAVDACPSGAVCGSAYRWGGIGQSGLQLPDIAPQSHAAVAVNASKIRLDQGTGDEFRVLPRHAAVGEDLRAQLRQPEVMDMLHRSSSGVGTGDNRPQYTRETGGCPTNRERIPSF